LRRPGGERTPSRFELVSLLLDLPRQGAIGEHRRAEEIEGVRGLHLGGEDIFEKGLLRQNRDAERPLASRAEAYVDARQHILPDL